MSNERCVHGLAQVANSEQAVGLNARELFMEDRSFELVGKLSNLFPIVRRLESLQQGHDNLIGCVCGSGNRSRLHFCSLYKDMAGAPTGVCPSRLNGFACAFTTLLGGELGGSCRTTLFSTLPPQCNCGGILLRGHALLYVSGHERIPLDAQQDVAVGASHATRDPLDLKTKNALCLAKSADRRFVASAPTRSRGFRYPASG